MERAVEAVVEEGQDHLGLLTALLIWVLLAFLEYLPQIPFVFQELPEHRVLLADVINIEHRVSEVVQVLHDSTKLLASEQVTQWAL